jgi:hypothetical protein
MLNSNSLVGKDSLAESHRSNKRNWRDGIITDFLFFLFTSLPKWSGLRKFGTARTPKDSESKFTKNLPLWYRFLTSGNAF